MKLLHALCWTFCLFLTISCNTKKVQSATIEKSPQLKALIIDGENNHGVWPKTTVMMKDYLEETGMFSVDIARKKYTWQGPHHNVKNPEDVTELLEWYPISSADSTVVVEEPKKDEGFRPNFSDYDLVVSNLGWKATEWPEETKKNFVDYMKNGGGLIVIHAANNSFGNWREYNEMIGIGGWGGRNKESGPYIYLDEDQTLVRDTTDGKCGAHGPQKEFAIQNRAPEHPIMNGLPAEWMHSKDELYERLRGPAENVTILATAYTDRDKNKAQEEESPAVSGRYEPMLLAINYGKGRIFHSTLGHMDYSMEGVGFIATFQRGAEWAATGKVTQPVPTDFPTKNESSSRKWKK